MSNCVAYAVAVDTPAYDVFRKLGQRAVRPGTILFVSPEELQSLKDDMMTIPLQEVRAEDVPVLKGEITDIGDEPSG